jgi:lipoprotein-releasing system ATP-binding protein
VVGLQAELLIWSGYVSPEKSASGGIEARNLCYEIADRVILRSLNLSVEPGESVSITGPSGCGKSTLLSCLSGLLSPTSGTVKLAGHTMTALSANRRAAARLRSVGMVYQFGELLPELTPLENVALPALMAGIPADKTYARARQLIEELGLSQVLAAATGGLSGGERQRVAVGRALIGEPAVVLADEPTGALDGEAENVVSDLLFSLPATRGCALAVVTHNQSVASRADRVLVMRDGILTSDGRHESVATS